MDNSAEIGQIFDIEYASESSWPDASTDAIFIYKRMKIPLGSDGSSLIFGYDLFRKYSFVPPVVK